LPFASFRTAGRVDVSKVWRACLERHGPDHVLYRRAQTLACRFDKDLAAAAPPPLHLGARGFAHGAAWVDQAAEVYWADEHAWHSARVLEYLGQTEGGGVHWYRFEYGDGATETRALPSFDVGFPGHLGPEDRARLLPDPLPPWPGHAAPAAEV
jgi:hypothetical protein